MGGEESCFLRTLDIAQVYPLVLEAKKQAVHKASERGVMVSLTECCPGDRAVLGGGESGQLPRVLFFNIRVPGATLYAPIRKELAANGGATAARSVHTTI